jgi:hypothetical protein
VIDAFINLVLDFCKKAVKLMEDHAPLSKLVKIIQSVVGGKSPYGLELRVL